MKRDKRGAYPRPRTTPLGIRLTELRNEKGWSIEAASFECRVTPLTYGRVELGKHIPVRAVFERMAAAYGVDVETLLELK